MWGYCLGLWSSSGLMLDVMRRGGGLRVRYTGTLAMHCCHQPGQGVLMWVMYMMVVHAATSPPCWAGAEAGPSKAQRRPGRSSSTPTHHSTAV